MTPLPIARAVLEHAQAQPRRVAVRCVDRVRRYGELARDVEAVARAWRSARRTTTPARSEGPVADTWAGAVVAIELPDPLDALTAVLAADLVGATPLVCDPAWNDAHRSSVLAPIAPAACVSADPVGIRPAPARTPDGTPGPGPAPEHRWAGFTSGSTGRPRAVVRSAASWTGSYGAVSRLTGTTGADTVLVPGPLSSSLYAFAALHTLASGATLELLPRVSPRSLAQRLPEADIVHLVPHMLDDVVDRIAGAGRLRTAVVGGAALAEPKRERAAAAGVDVVAYYGAAELSFVAVDPDGAGLRAFPGVTIDVRTPPGHDAGEVRVRSPWVADGYLSGASGPLRRDDDGWATVGDLAEPRRPGEPLRLRGRGDGAVTTGGATVVPEDVESVLAAVPGVAGVVVVGTPHERLGHVLTAVVETRGRAAVPRTVLEAAARAGLAPAQRPRRWFAVDTLPRTSAGKPARAVVGDAVSAGPTGMRPLS